METKQTCINISQECTDLERSRMQVNNPRSWFIDESQRVTNIHPRRKRQQFPLIHLCEDNKNSKHVHARFWIFPTHYNSRVNSRTSKFCRMVHQWMAKNVSSNEHCSHIKTIYYSVPPDLCLLEQLQKGTISTHVGGLWRVGNWI